jgi:N-acetyl-gamma-glutamyl-phosphate reductase
MPEIEEKVKKVKNKEFQINFVPHLLPITRGMLVSVFATLKEEIDVEKVLEDAYKDSEFVRVRKTPVDLKSTAGTNFCDIFVSRNGKALFINSSIDNLLRGASSQAVVNANIMCGYEEGEGIPKIAYVP